MCMISVPLLQGCYTDISCSNAPSCNERNTRKEIYNALLGNYKIMQYEGKTVVDEIHTKRTY